MKEIFINRKTEHASERNRFTRMCIGEAIVLLMQNCELDKIRVAEIAKKAGISRMTYYHYYDSKIMALQDYLEEIILLYLEENRIHHIGESFREFSHLLFSLEFFDRYSKFFVTMNRAGLYSIMIDAINRFMAEHLPQRYPNSAYELFYYAGGLLNIFLRWEEDGKKISSSELAKVIASSQLGDFSFR